jgi:N-acetylmuramoyl-L-alanine amidase
MKYIVLFFVFFLGFSLSGCSTVQTIDRTYNSVGQDSRIRYLILHYTFGDFASSLKTLTQGEVSSHYLIDVNPPKVYLLVDESARAYHAGQSYWRGNTALNASSIGIEIVNSGGRPGIDGKVTYAQYPKAQMDVVIALVKDIMKRHSISPDRVLGHSDIAPGRKDDPGPQFPWKRLADEGLAVWPDEARVAARLPGYVQQLPDASWFQQKLKQYGYNAPQTAVFDQATKDCLVAFQMRFRPSNFDGNPDAQSAAILDVLNSAYP